MTDVNGAPAAYSPAPAAPAENPGKTMGIIALVASFFISLLGIILGFVALNKSKKAGFKNGPALAAIILGFIFLIAGIAIAAAVGAGISAFAGQCAELGSGVWETSPGVTITCP